LGGVAPPNGEFGIVGQHRARARHQGRGARAPALHVEPRGRAADPFAVAAGERGAAVQAHRELHAQPRPAALHARQEAAVDLARLRFHQADRHLDPRRAQALVTGAVHLRERIAHRTDHACHAGFDQRIGTGRGAAGMRAGLERDVGGGATRAIARGAQREHFGMRLPGTRVEAFADHLAIAHQHAAHHRVRLGRVRAALGEPQRARHHGVVERGECGVGHVDSWRRGVMRASARARRRTALPAGRRHNHQPRDHAHAR